MKNYFNKASGKDIFLFLFGILFFFSTAATAETFRVIKAEVGSSIWSLVGIGIAIFLILSGSIFLVLKSSKIHSLSELFGTRKFRILVLILLSVFIAVVVVISWLALGNIKEKVLDHTKSELEIVLKSTAQRLFNWVDTRKRFLDQLGRDPELVEITERLLEVPNDRNALISSTPLHDIRNFFESNEERFGKSGFFIISPDLISIGSMRDSNTGTRNFIADLQPGLFEKAFRGAAVFIPPIRSDVVIGNANGQETAKKQIPPTMFFVAPIRKQDGTVIAVLIQRLQPEKAFSRELQFGRVGKSGETYAFDKNGLLLSNSRFEEHLRKVGLIKPGESSMLNVEIRDPGGNMLEGYSPKNKLEERELTRMAKSAIRGEHGTDLDGYRDYRGVPVFGSWIWYEPFKFGITTEIDVEEALSTFNTLKMTIFTLLGATLFSAIVVILFTLALGERAHLTAALARDGLEARVEERTVELLKSLKVSENLRQEADQAKREAERLARSAARNAVMSEGLRELSEKMQGKQNVSELADEVIGYIARFLRLPTGSLFISSIQDGTLHRAANYGYYKTENLPQSFELGSGLIGQAAVEGKPIIIDDIPQYARVAFGFGEIPLKSILIVPLVSNNYTMGILELGNTKSFSDYELNWIKQAAQSITMMFQSVMLISEL